MSLKILWMIPKWTLPVTDGARVATDSLIRNTILAGAKVDVLCLPVASEETNPEAMKKAWNVEDVAILPREVPSHSLSKKLFFLSQLIIKPFIPLTFSSFVGSKIENAVIDHINKGQYDIVLLDGLHLGAPLFRSDKLKNNNRTKVIYRAHNIEADLWKKAYQEKKNPFLKFILYIQSFLVESFEKKIILKSHGVAAISQEDLVEIDKIKKSHTTLIPLGLNFKNALSACKDEQTKFLFIGRLDWPPNRDGLEWLLKEVWPSVIEKRPHAILKIVGSGNKDWLKNYKSLKGVDIVGFVDSIRDAYEDCHFTVVPVFYGSGTRIKVLESFAMGRKLVSSKMGVQGADLDEDDYINAETKEDWIRTLSTVHLDPKTQTQLELSCLKVASKFGDKEIGEKFYGWLKTLS